MQLTLYVTICGMSSVHAATLGAIRYTSLVNPVIVDQASPEPHEKNLRTVFPECRYVKFPDNLGIQRALKFMEQDCTTELGGTFHSDFIVWEPLWDHKIELLFERNPKLGVVGFFGARVAHLNGGREYCVSAMNGWNLHTPVFLHAPETCAVLDGMGMIWRTAALREIGGFDERIGYEVYDRDLCMGMLTHGWEVGVVPLQCHHVGSVDAFLVQQQLKQETYDLYNQKWQSVLPFRVESRLLET